MFSSLTFNSFTTTPKPLKHLFMRIQKPDHLYPITPLIDSKDIRGVKDDVQSDLCYPQTLETLSQPQQLLIYLKISDNLFKHKI